MRRQNKPSSAPRNCGSGCFLRVQVSRPQSDCESVLSITRKKHALAVEFQLRPWPQTSGNIGENYGDGTWSAGLNASRCICWKNPSVRRCSKLCAEPLLWLKPESCNFPNSEPGHRASGKRLPEKLVLSHSSIAVLRPRFSLCDEGILQEHKGRTSAQSEFFDCGTKALTARI